MKVKIEGYGETNDFANDKNMGFVTYKVSNLDAKSLDYLKENLEGKIKIANDFLYITLFYNENMFPFQSNEAKAKINDFISCEEIEMTAFLTSFLEDMH